MALAATLRTLSDDQLLDELADAKAELFNLRFAFATGQSPSSAQVSAVKRDIARIHTVLREREIAAAEMQQSSAVADPAPLAADHQPAGAAAVSASPSAPTAASVPAAAADADAPVPDAAADSQPDVPQEVPPR